MGYGICCQLLKLCRFSDFAACIVTNFTHAAVDVVAKYGNGQYRSDHKAPPGVLSRHVDPQIASQMGIGVLTAVVLFAGINMTFVVVFRIVVSSRIFHGVSPRSWFGCRLHSFLVLILAME